jgi:hypothetical protein
VVARCICVLYSDLSGEDKGLQVRDQFEAIVDRGNIGGKDNALGSHDGYVLREGRCYEDGGRTKSNKSGEKVNFYLSSSVKP